MTQNTSLPKISIVIPTYNYGRFLETAIKSVLDQNYPNIELIILDGGSTDNTVEIIKKYSDHIAKWRSHKDLCSNATVNEGFDMATGELVGLLCADDWYEPGIFHDAAEALELDNNLDIISFHVQYVDNEGEVVRTVTDAMKLDSFGEAAPNGRFYRRSLFDSYGKMTVMSHDKQFILCADYEYMIRMSFQPIRHRVLNRLGYTYLMHEGSFSYGNKFYLTTEKILEEHAEIASRYLSKGDLYSEKVFHRFRHMHSVSTAKLYLIRNMYGDKKGAAFYMFKGMRRNPEKWRKILKKIKQDESFKELLKQLKQSESLMRVQTLKD